MSKSNTVLDLVRAGVTRIVMMPPPPKRIMKRNPLETELRLYRMVMHQIADQKIRTHAQRLAASLIEFVEAMKRERAKRKARK